MAEKIFDTHAHYFDRKFGELEGGAESVLESAEFLSTVCGVINVATNPENAARCLEQTAKYDFMYAAVGIHPSDAQNECKGTPAEELCRLEKIIGDADNRKKQRIVAIGEIGYDYYWQPVDRELQRTYFDAQMKLASRLDLPVIIHDREANGDCLDAVFAHPNVRGVFHSYSGSAESAKELVKRGWYISFSGVVTFKNASRLAEIVPTIPSDRLLTETDCPYLTPHPHRGERNDSSYLTYTIEKLASLYGATPDEIAALTLKNAATLFSKCGIITEA